jgi:hypothetical protein
MMIGWGVLLVTAASADDTTYGGGGIVLHDERISYYDPGTWWVDDLERELVCVGGQGFRADRGLRQGAEAHVCGGDGPVLITAGPQFGWIGHGGGFYASLHASAGAGVFGATDGVEWGGMLVYAKPTAAAAWAPGPFAIELGAYLMLPLEVVAWTPTSSVFGPGVPHVGGQLSVLFGNFDDIDRVAIEAPEGAVVQ